MDQNLNSFVCQEMAWVFVGLSAETLGSGDVQYRWRS